MQPTLPPAPGLAIEKSADGLLISIDRETVSPLLSVLLNSKFGYAPRVEFLTNPYVNQLIEALLGVARKDHASAIPAPLEGERAPELASAEQEIRRWAADNGIAADEESELVDLALFPWN